MGTSTAKKSTGTARTAHTSRTSRSAHRTPARAVRRTRPAARPVPRPVVVRVSGTHLTARGRLVVLLGLVGLLLVGFSLGRSTEAATTTAPAPAVTQTTVQAGESLWTVAQRVAPGTDPRETVQRLRRLNHLSGSGLYAGQQLLLPA